MRLRRSCLRRWRGDLGEEVGAKGSSGFRDHDHDREGAMRERRAMNVPRKELETKGRGHT